MTNIEDLYTDPCQKLDSWCVDAYFDLKLTPADSAELTLDNSWGTTSVDLTPAVKSAETVTHLFLTPEDKPTALQYNREDYGRDGAENGGLDCINGDDLSHIISMKYLKDVSQTAPTDGDVYMYHGITNLFTPFDLKSWMAQTNDALQTHAQSIEELQNGLNNLNTTMEQSFATVNNRLANIESNIANIQNRLSAIEATIAKPSWAPAGAVLAWGTTNTAKNSSPTTQGIWTHNPNSNVIGDTRFD